MKRDIETTGDIKMLVDAFYKKVIPDAEIGYYFTTVIKLDWNIHIPVMYSFWETVLLGKLSYKGNPVKQHIELDKKEKLLPAHFERWLYLWAQTIDEYFEGLKAAEAKQKAETMARLMLLKIDDSKNRNFVQ
jgi:hemoglobin